MLIDLTHLFTASVPTYPGDPAPEIKQWASLEKDGFTDHTIHTGMHVGTHMDGPAHMVVGGRKLCDFPPERFVTAAKILSLSSFGKGGGRRPEDFLISLEDLKTTDLHPGEALIIRTGFSERFNDPSYFTDYPILTEEAARYLVEKRIGILGIDWPSPDREPFAVHRILLGAEILIIENLTNLSELTNAVSPLARGSTRAKRGGGSCLPFTLFALPLKVDADSAPVRVIAKL